MRGEGQRFIYFASHKNFIMVEEHSIVGAIVPVGDCYKELEKKVYETPVKLGERISIKFPGDVKHTCLELGGYEKEGRYHIVLFTPWFEQFLLGRYTSEDAAREVFEHYDKCLAKGCTVLVTGGDETVDIRTAQIITTE